MGNDAVPFLYWKAASILGEFSVDSFNPGLMMEIPGAVALAVRALELEEDYDQGSIHDLFIAVYGNLPASLVYRTVDEDSNYSVISVLESYYAGYGLSFKEMSFNNLAMFHLDLSVEFSNGMKASPYVLASTIYINNQDSDGFIFILQKALEIDINQVPEKRLMNIISQRKAKWLINNIEDYFFIL